MKRYLLLTLDEEKGAQACIGKAEARDDYEGLIPDVMFTMIDDEVLEEGIPFYSKRQNQMFKDIVEGAIELLQCAKKIEENK